MRKARGSKTRSTKRRTKKTSRKTPKRRAASSRRGSSRSYGTKAGDKVERSMHEMKRGKLRSGRSSKKVTSRKQAIAIGLSEARQSGAKVPPRRRSSR
jgi:Family of unknown function (DUF6496)